MTRRNLAALTLGIVAALAARASSPTDDTGASEEYATVDQVPREDDDTGRPEWEAAGVVELPAKAAKEVHEAFPELTLDTYGR